MFLLNSFVANLVKMYNKGNYLNIANVTPHPNYDKNTATHDIALIELKGKLTLSDTVKPACLAKSDYIAEHKGQLMVSFWL